MVYTNEGQNKLSRYYREAELYRSLPKGNWRGGWRRGAAAGLRMLAARLEAPYTEPLKGAPRVG